MSPDALNVTERVAEPDPEEAPPTLPRGWAWASLGEILPLEYGKALPERVRDCTGKVAVYGSSGRLGRHTTALVQGPTLIVGRKGSAGAVFYCDEDCWPIDTVYFAKPKPVIDLRYGFYFLRWTALGRLDQSTAIPSLSRDIYSDVRIPLAPLPEQRRIVARIDELFGEIEEGEAALERACQGLGTWRRALLKAAVTGELTRDWREANRPAETGADLLARIRAEVGTPEALQSISLPKLPDGWAWAPLGEILESLRNGTATVPVKRQTDHSILRISAVRPMAVDASDIRYLDENSARGLEEFRTQFGDLLFTRYNGSRHLVGVCGIFRGERPVDYPDKIIRARLAPQLQDIGPFFEAAINSGATRKFIDGEIKTTAGQHGISGASLKRAPIPVPPIAEAKRIVELLRDDLSRADDMEALQVANLNSAVALRQSILKTAFEGRLVPQNPTDEPASVLLARLWEESAGADAARGRRGRKRDRREAVDLPLFGVPADQPSADAG
jgi:type I restriction enzyme, S subunit